MCLEYDVQLGYVLRPQRGQVAVVAVRVVAAQPATQVLYVEPVKGESRKIAILTINALVFLWSGK